MVLVREDLHWADPGSLELLRFIAAHLHQYPLLVLGTYRESELQDTSDLSQTLGELARERTFRRLSLEGLDAEHVAELLAHVMSRDATLEKAESVASLTEGNPFFVIELARILDVEGSEPRSGDMAEGFQMELPASIFDAVARRLGRLGASSHKLLSTASVIGREFSTTLLSEVAGPEQEPILMPHVNSMETRRSMSLEALDLSRACGDVEGCKDLGIDPHVKYVVPFERLSH